MDQDRLWKIVMLAVVFLFVTVPIRSTAQAGMSIGIRLPPELYYNPLEPKTPGQVRRSYLLVQPADGINATEAKIIAQNVILTRRLESSYEIGKPKILKETPRMWVVRLPARFSISGGDNRPLVVCVDKKTGALGCPPMKSNVQTLNVK